MKIFNIILLHITTLFGLTLSAQAPSPKALEAEFDALMSAQFKSNETGAAVLVARKGQVIYKKGFGLANLEHGVPMKAEQVFRIGSITKQFTAIAILQLMEQGKLNLQDEITRFLPDYPTQGHKITIEHLLTHTSGIQSYTAMKDYRDRMELHMTPEDMINHFKHEPMLFAPGSQWDYSNSGYFLLGYIIEKASGKPYPAYLQESIFNPFGLARTLYADDTRIIRDRAGLYDQHEDTYINARPLSLTQPYAAGAIMSTVEDLFIWHEALLAYKVVSKNTLDMAFSNHKLADGTLTGYGYGWMFNFINELPSIEHSGGINGALTVAIHVPAEDVFVAVFSNCECNPPHEVAAKLAAIASGKPYPTQAIAPDKATIMEYAGVYENDKGEQRIITLDGENLMSQRGRNKQFLIKPYAKDHYFFDNVLMTIEFARNKEGRVDRLITHNREANDIYLKTGKQIPSGPEAKTLDTAILDQYVGQYEMGPDFSFVVTRDQSRMFVQAVGQEQFEIFAEREGKFFTHVNDATFDFRKDDTGQVTAVLLRQGGQEMVAKKKM